MNNVVVGALRGVLTLDTGDWTPAVRGARGDLASLRTAFEQIGRVLDDVSQKARNWGLGLTAGVTVPLGALAASSNKTASGFEASMKRVEAALRGVTGKELKQLSDQARELGPRVGKGATEAADGIEALGLAGVSTANIIGGALKSSLDLAAAGAAPVAEAAALVTDVMGQFKVQASDLPTVVNDVVGSLDASKFGFIDFQQAIAQGGGVAASAGINFRDFATAIAATSMQFSSGSDAGTSFKTYIQSLVPVSKEAEYAMKTLGIEFFDMQTGRMKPLAEQAEVLRKAFDGLSDQSKTDALKTIFGSDAARTAIGLMEQGAKGIADLQNEIAQGDVGAKIDKRLEGEAAATNRMANAWESLKIAIGEAGLTAIITSVKNAVAGLLESLSRASPELLKVGVIIGAVAAALGPLAIAFGAIASFIFAKLARGFGALGWAISAVIEPIGTLSAALIRLLAGAGIKQGLGILARAFLGITGPIGWAVTAVITFADSIIPALQQVWQMATQTLGPPLIALFDKVGDVVSKIASGPIGAGFGALIEIFGTVLDVAGTFVAGIVELLGAGLVNALEIAIRAISGVVDVVISVVDVISALLLGDFAGAWEAAGNVVDAVCQTIVDIIGMMYPSIAEPVQAIYTAVKAALVDGFSEIATAFTAIVASAVTWVANAFPGVTAAAKAVYEGVKGWLVDKFGGLMTWIANAAKWIGNKYGALKDRLGLGGAKADSAPAPPEAPKPAAAPPVSSGSRIVDFTPPKNSRAKRTPKGRDTTYDAGNRDQLRIEAELDAARARGDKEAEQRIQDQLALSKQVEAYQRTGLTLDQARVAAQRDMNEIHAARAQAAAREIADEQAANAIDVARLGNDRALEESLERQAELKRRIAFYYEQTKNLAEATALAEADQAQIDDARARARQRWFADDAQDRELRLAQQRGDSEEHIRQLQREVDIRERIRDLQDQGMSAPDAAAKAVAEANDQEKARITGVWRSTIQDGMRAALDGNIGDWMKNWWKDRIAKGMEEAINSLADLISKLFSRAGSSSGGGGGLFGSIGSAIGGIFGGSKSSLGGNAAVSAAAAGVNWNDLPGFATGGSFKVGGMSGIDNNLVAFRATRGEMVDIRKPGADGGPRGGGTVQNFYGPGADAFWGQVDSRAAGVAAPMAAASGAHARAAAGGDVMRQGRRRIPGR